MQASINVRRQLRDKRMASRQNRSAESVRRVNALGGLSSKQTQRLVVDVDGVPTEVFIFGLHAPNDPTKTRIVL
jgi:hypothetical protein